MIDIFIWMKEVVFGRIVSSQIKSSNDDADFWLIDRLWYVGRRCMMEGEYPSMLENLYVCEGYLNFR